MLNYYRFIEHNKCIYSIDMLRLSCYIKNYEVSEIMEYLKLNCTEYYVINSGKIGTYVNNFKISGFWVGIGCETSKALTSEQLITIEFNPNKCLPGSTALVYLLNRLNNRLKIKRFDLAIDIPFNILNLNFENLTKRSSTVLYEYQDNRTIYFGKGNGHTKIYNKKIESNLDYELTRYEITKEIDCPVSMINGFPEITFNFLSCNLMPYNEHTDNKTYNAIAYALNNGYHFKDLSRDMQKNIIKNAKFNFELSEQVANNVLRATINSIFLFL